MAQIVNKSDKSKATLPPVMRELEKAIDAVHSQNGYEEKLDTALTELPKIISILANPALAQNTFDETIENLFKDMHSVNKKEQLTKVFDTVYEKFSAAPGGDRTIDLISSIKLNTAETTLIKTLLAVKIAHSESPYSHENVLIVINYLPSSHSAFEEIKKELWKLLR